MEDENLVPSKNPLYVFPSKNPKINKDIRAIIDAEVENANNLNDLAKVINDLDQLFQIKSKSFIRSQVYHYCAQQGYFVDEIRRKVLSSHRKTDYRMELLKRGHFKTRDVETIDLFDNYEEHSLLPYFVNQLNLDCFYNDSFSGLYAHKISFSIIATNTEHLFNDKSSKGLCLTPKQLFNSLQDDRYTVYKDIFCFVRAMIQGGHYDEINKLIKNLKLDNNRKRINSTFLELLLKEDISVDLIVDKHLRTYDRIGVHRDILLEICNYYERNQELDKLYELKNNHTDREAKNLIQNKIRKTETDMGIRKPKQKGIEIA